jgi:hypothetical protein
MRPVDRDVTLETFKQLVCDDSWKKEPTFAREDFLVELRGFRTFDRPLCGHPFQGLTSLGRRDARSVGSLRWATPVEAIRSASAMAARILIVVITTIQDQQIVECKTTGRHITLVCLAKASRTNRHLEASVT